MKKRSAFLWGSNGSHMYSPLYFAKEDVTRLAAVLRAPRYAFETEIFDATDDPFDCFRALKKAVGKCALKDLFVCHYSGHGQIIGNKLYLVMDNSHPDYPSTLFSSSWLIEAFQECRAANRLLILDCCHAGAATGVKGHGASVEALIPELAATQQILYASGRLEEAREFPEFGGSFVTRTLCDLLDTAPQGEVTLSSVVSQLQYRANNHNKNQNVASKRVPVPFLSGVHQGDFYFDDKRIATDSAAKITVSRFWFDYQFEPEPGRREWQQLDEIRWRELYPGGHVSLFVVVNRIRMNGLSGFVVRKVVGDVNKTQVTDYSMELFFPDPGPGALWAMMRHSFGNDRWGPWEYFVEIRYY